MLIAAVMGAAASGAEPRYGIEEGPFAADWNSLKQYECPDWFRDAKFGIWAHYGAQCEAEHGDWYARNLYMPAEKRYYDHHVKTYGHPSKFGFKDICHAWKNENWQPDRLMQLYKAAGAKYFVAMANHHCNFDNWNSKHQPWNSVNIGPQQDLIAGWAKSAQAQGLRFGVSVHNARSWDWYAAAHESDTEGPLKGVPYDGALTKADGRGQWWEGYDPADLYGPHGEARTPAARQKYIDNWFARTKDLIDSYEPDLLYFDDTDLPLGDAGLHIGAHFYNANMRQHGGKLEAVLNSKRAPPGARQAIVLDLERRTRGALDARPWQTDTCIGNWHYQRNIDWYRNPTDIIHELVDVVSKNGNLLLSIPIRGDGTLDEREEKFLADMAAWMKVNEACLFGTRPWQTYGEGPLRDAGGSVLQDKLHGVPLAEVRFTTKGEKLYAIAFVWPEDGKLWIRSLAKPSGGDASEVASIKLLGHAGEIAWERSEHGLLVTLPREQPCEHAFALEIIGKNLSPVPLPINTAIPPAADGRIFLGANRAVASGYSPSFHRRAQEDVVGSIGTWADSSDRISWELRVPAAGEYRVEISYGCQTNCAGSDYTLHVGKTPLAGKVAGTGSWHDFVTAPLGTVHLEAGVQKVSLVPTVKGWNSMEVRAVVLTPVK